MIVKQHPDDFCVEELTDVRPSSAGPFALYRLTKTGWTTPDALSAIRRRWNIDPSRLQYGGLKDRHAQTIQYFSIHHGPARKFVHQRILVEHIGQLQEPYTSTSIRANRFRLTLRGIDSQALAFACDALKEVGHIGLPNYFDDQRFGSVQPGQPFLAKAMIDGDFETALKLALTAPYEFDRAPQKKEKAVLRKHWGDWPALMQSLPRGHARSLVSYLVHHPADFRGAIVRLRPELRGLYLSAYQSFLWNRILARWLTDTMAADSLRSVQLRLGPVPMPIRMSGEERDRLSQASIPLPSSRLQLPEDDPLLPFVNSVMAEEGLTLSQMQIKGVRELFFSKGERAAHINPKHLRWSNEPDETRPGKSKLLVDFELPRGSYATLLVKLIGGDA